MTMLRRDDDPRHIVRIFLRGERVRFRRCIARIRFHFVERVTRAADLKFLQRGRWFDLGTSNRQAALQDTICPIPLGFPKFVSEIVAALHELRKMGHWEPY
jgi:hypothetical protein